MVDTTKATGSSITALCHLPHCEGGIHLTGQRGSSGCNDQHHRTAAHVFALSQQDITPYGNGLYHLNSILQPATATKAPVVGVAVTTETTVAGCATGATHLEDLEDAGRFMLEAAKAFGNGLCSFYDEEEFGRIQKLYGSMEHFQTLGKQ